MGPDCYGTADPISQIQDGGHQREMHLCTFSSHYSKVALLTQGAW